MVIRGNDLRIALIQDSKSIIHAAKQRMAMLGKMSRTQDSRFRFPHSAPFQVHWENPNHNPIRINSAKELLCVLTHCGWGGTLECMLAGKAVICGLAEVSCDSCASSIVL